MDDFSEPVEPLAPAATDRTSKDLPSRGETPVRAVTWDFGQTLSRLDSAFLSARAATRGLRVSAGAIHQAMPRAWSAYDGAKRSGKAAEEAWRAFMGTLLRGAGVREPDAGRLAQWLWTEQPTKNLWRALIVEQIAIVAELAERGVPLAVVSNSEGHLAELLAELGLDRWFPVVADSGRLGMEKPEPGIFAWAAERLGVAPAQVLHVGDLWEADVVGALRFGAQAFWYTSTVSRRLPVGVAAGTEGQLRARLVELGLLPARGTVADLEPEVSP